MINSAVELCEVWRGSLRESLHIGHAVVCDSSGEIVKSWGDPEKIFYSRIFYTPDYHQHLKNF